MFLLHFCCAFFEITNVITSLFHEVKKEIVAFDFSVPQSAVRHHAFVIHIATDKQKQGLPRRSQVQKER